MHSSPTHQLQPPAAVLRLAPAVVLDTNVVMDWLVFRDPACAAWAQRFGEGDVRWLVSTAMREELAHVLGRGVARDWRPCLKEVWGAWERYALTVEGQPASGPGRIRCTDVDDQKFIDLALAHRVRWLVSRDKALLKLRRRLWPLGLEVLTPGDWNAVTPLAQAAPEAKDTSTTAGRTVIGRSGVGACCAGLGPGVPAAGRRRKKAKRSRADD